MKKAVFISFTLATALSQAQTFDGIDISHHNWVINRKQLPKDIKFIYIKATEGGTYVDPRYKANVDSATAHKFKIGSYPFFRMTSSAETQFQNIKRTVAKSKQKLIPMVDVELNGKDRSGWKIDGYHTSNRSEKTD